MVATAAVNIKQAAPKMKIPYQVPPEAENPLNDCPRRSMSSARECPAIKPASFPHVRNNETRATIAALPATIKPLRSCGVAGVSHETSFTSTSLLRSDNSFNNSSSVLLRAFTAAETRS